jgi:hypothetical protein
MSEEKPPEPTPSLKGLHAIGYFMVKLAVVWLGSIAVQVVGKALEIPVGVQFVIMILLSLFISFSY